MQLLRFRYKVLERILFVRIQHKEKFSRSHSLATPFDSSHTRLLLLLWGGVDTGGAAGL